MTERNLTLALALLGTYIIAPVCLLLGLLWFVDTVRTHAIERDLAEPAGIPGRYGPEIQKCDKPLWDRVTDGCDE